MADTQLRFIQIGGAHDFTVPVADMADYPVEQDVVLARQIDTTWGGKTYTYQKYNKKRWLLHFNDITEASWGTLGSIAQQGYDFALYYGSLVGVASGLYATCFYAGPTWPRNETALGLFTVDFLVEQVTSNTDTAEVGTVKLYEGTAYTTVGTVDFAGTASGITVMNNDGVLNGRMWFNFNGGTLWFPLPGFGANWHRETNVAETYLYHKADSTGTVPFAIITVE